MKEYSFQLTEQQTGRALHHTGKYVVTSAGTVVCCQTYDSNDAATTQPLSITGGKVEFRTAESINSVDVFGYTDQGFAFQAKGLKPGEINEFNLDTSKLNQVFLYPINYSSSNTYGDVRVPHVSNENVTNMYLPDGVLINAKGSGLVVTTAESAKSLDVGFDNDGAGSGTNDPDGLFDGMLFTSTGFKPAMIGYVLGTNSVYVDLTGGTQEWTSGALLHPASSRVANAEGTDSATTKNGFAVYTPHAVINSGANVSNLTYTFGGTPTAIKGFIRLEWDIPTAPAFT